MAARSPPPGSLSFHTSGPSCWDYLYCVVAQYFPVAHSISGFNDGLHLPGILNYVKEAFWELRFLN